MALDPRTEAKFWKQVVEDSKRTVVCHPGMEERCRLAIEQLGLEAIVTLLPSSVCPEGVLYSIDENALKADFNESLSRSTRRIS